MRIGRPVHAGAARVVAALSYSSSRQQLVVDFDICCIAAAGGRFQATAIEDRQVTAPICDQRLTLQQRSRGRNAYAAHAKHEGKELMG